MMTSHDITVINTVIQGVLTYIVVIFTIELWKGLTELKKYLSLKE
jgi:hypothetical protein